MKTDRTITTMISVAYVMFSTIASILIIISSIAIMVLLLVVVPLLLLLLLLLLTLAVIVVVSWKNKAHDAGGKTTLNKQ